jgi:hypothetical protein
MEQSNYHMITPNANFELSLDQVEVDIKTYRIDNQGDLDEEGSINQPLRESFSQDMDFDEVKKRTEGGIQERKKRL